MESDEREFSFLQCFAITKSFGAAATILGGLAGGILVARYGLFKSLLIAVILASVLLAAYAGVLERFPRLKFLSVENEIGWIPFYLQQWDYYYRRFVKVNPLPIKREPSTYFMNQIGSTFFRDEAGGHAMEWWGEDCCMWSNDYPHFNMTFPHSRHVVEHHLKGLSEERRELLTRDNAIKLFNLELA